MSDRREYFDETLQQWVVEYVDEEEDDEGNEAKIEDWRLENNRGIADARGWNFGNGGNGGRGS